MNIIQAKTKAPVDQLKKVADKLSALLDRFENSLPSSPVILSRNRKTEKSVKVGYLTATVHLSPSNESVGFGGRNMCLKASKGCQEACLNKSGMHRFPTHEIKRVALTLAYIRHRQAFEDRLKAELRAFARKAEKEGLLAAVRINTLSDQRGLAQRLATWAKSEGLPLKFYDYTKLSPRQGRDGYFLTFSLSESNEAEALEALSNGMNVAAVFNLAKGEALPKSWFGYPVVDGDDHDAIFIHGAGKTCVVGLRLKGSKAAKLAAVSSGFAITLENRKAA